MSLKKSNWLALYAAPPALAVLLTSGAAFAITPPSVTVLNQPVKSNAIDITYANLPRDGFLVVLGSDANGKPSDRAIGTAELKAGDHREVKVQLSEAAKPGEKLWVSLYDNTDGKAGFDMKGDKPFWTGKLPDENMFIVK